MTQHVDAPVKTFQAGGAIGRRIRVKLNASNQLAVADSTDTDWIGVTEQEAFAANEWIPVRLRTAQGTFVFTASEAVTASDALYAAASGKVATSGTVLVGEALEDASGDGSEFEGLVSPAAVLGAIARSALTQDDLAEYVVKLSDCKVHDAMATTLTGTANNDDMAYITGTPGTDAPTLQGVDFGGTTSDEKCAFEFVLPPEYVAGQTITLAVTASMVTTVSDGTATIDAECWVADDAGAVGSDICATAAQSINSLTPATKSFTITPTSRAPGDRLIIRLSFAGSDTGDAGVMIPEIQKVALLLDIKG